MVKDILNRYDKDDNGNIIIKISTDTPEDLYNDFDKESSFLKKDLQEELVDYIIQSVNEIGKEPFVLRFYFSKKIHDKVSEKIKNSIKNFFEYLQDLEKNKMEEQIKNSLIFMFIGIFFTALSIGLGNEETITQKIISEGLMVAGWVSLWEALATFLIKWLPLSKKLKTYKRIAGADVFFE